MIGEKSKVPSESFKFTGAAGHALAARLERPIGPIRAVAVFAHCFTCTMQSHAATRLTAALARTGIATLRFDFTGLGGSDGDFGNAGFAADVADIIAAADHLRATIEAPSILIGHSLGGAAVLAAAAGVPEAKAVVTIGAPFDAAHVLHQIDGDWDRIEREGEGDVRIASRPFKVSRNFLHAVQGVEPERRIAALGRALLVLHAPRDATVGIENARLIYDAARHPKSFVSLDDADHLLTRLADAEYAANLIAAWVARYLPPLATPVLDEGAVRVSNGAGKWGTLIEAGAHRWIADEPRKLAGEDAGPSPYDLLLASLGACTSMTLKFYAEREGIALDKVTVMLSHNRNHAQDCDHCEEGGTRIEAIDRTVSLTGDLSAEDRARLMVIADKCPVHKTLTGDLHIHTRAAEPGE
ncbi:MULTISPECIES: bifunctional alpha/beta hydrolase/OsmC family protein [unclassified Sphingomonas]|jgi:putative redox protein|uniref:bifunctional alpha/beta hydrolase/OsmC family protein n=1 Tax=unclassified Sphingomonas TaxID=196159 RepID=UPI00082A8769|nr:MULTISPECIES: bifunctional alpha/beta hydrolase/OsmC family protein [unclassified Sphingomonas]